MAEIINSIENIESKYYQVICYDGDIEVKVPIRDGNVDLKRSKFHIKTGRKYSVTDIHIIQQKLFTQFGVESNSQVVE